ncbi:MAG TPA: hypothetical protein VIL35_15300 [Vicinamibacterales bacterium]
MTNQAPAPEPAPTAVERLTGHGKVYDGPRHLFDVEYDLMVTPSSQRGGTFEPGRERHDTPDITGRLKGGLYASERIVEGVHTLVLEDGRSFDFRVIQPETNEIVGVSWFHEGRRT